MDSAEESLGIF